MGGYKSWAHLENLEAADLNEYLMDQVVARFADDAERASFIPSPEQGHVTYLASTSTVQLFDGANWVDLVPVTGDSHNVGTDVALRSIWFGNYDADLDPVPPIDDGTVYVKGGNLYFMGQAGVVIPLGRASIVTVRPTASTVPGLMVFDSTLGAAGQPIWSNGTDWVDATGTVVT